MPTAITLPKFSATMEEGVVAEWKIAAGDAVSKGQVVVEIETDKATMEVESVCAGTAGPLHASQGEAVAVGARLVEIFADGEAVDEAPGTDVGNDGRPGDGPAVAPVLQDTETAPDEGAASSPRRPVVRASPLAKRLARQRGIEIGSLEGSGPKGRILAADVDAAQPDQSSQPAAMVVADGGQSPTVPGRADDLGASDASMRRAVARTVSQSRREIPSFSLHRWIDLETTQAMIERAADKRTLTDYFLQAVATASAQLSQFRSVWDSAAERVQPVEGHGVGLIVGVESGLRTTVISGLRDVSVAAIAGVRREAVAFARSGRSSPRFAGQAAVSISNLARGGADHFDAIIMPGQSAIVAIGRVREKVVPHCGGVAVRRGCTVTLSVDHRVIDGVQAADFLHHMSEYFEMGFAE